MSSKSRYFNSKTAPKPSVNELDSLLEEEVFGMKVDSIPRPTNDLVIIERLDEVRSEDNLILIPGMAQKGSRKFVCIAKGPGRTTEFGTKILPDQCEIGDEVYANLNEATAVPFVFGKRQLFLVASMNIMAVFPKASTIAE